ncbi:hypothetical protein Q7P37_005123 [Cladosporium fusiforme]
MGNVSSVPKGADNIPGAFPIEASSDKVLQQRKPGEKRKRSIQELPSNAMPLPPPSSRQVPKRRRQQHEKQQQQPVEEVASVPLSSIRAPEASLVLGEGLSLENDFSRLYLLGESTEGRVYKIRSRSGKVYALKVLRQKARSRNVRHLPEDCLLHLKKIPFHPHILFLSQIDITADAGILLCTTFANAGDLFGQIKRFEKLGTSVPPIFALHVFIQISEALGFLHFGYRRIGQGDWRKDSNHISILHGDIKPENILLHFDRLSEFSMPVLQVGDFGHSSLASNPPRLRGSPLYFSPEARAASRGDFSGPVMSTKSDVYTLGLTLYVLMTFSHWRTGTDPRVLTLLPAFDEIGFTGILKHCLAVNPRHRPSMDRSPGTGLLRCVDDCWTLRDQLLKQDGPPSRRLWKRE